MAVVGALHRIVFGGRLHETETWACSIHFLSAAAEVGVPVLATTGIKQWHERPDTLNSPAALLEYVKWNQINPVTGLYMDQVNVGEAFYGQGALVGSAVAPGGSSAYGDPAASFVASTKTALLRGPAHAGRFYPPTSPGPAYGADGRVSVAVALAMSVSAAQLITDLNGAAEGSCVVFSRKYQTTQEITGIRVGRTADHQSRRRRNIPEDYQSTPVS